MSETFQRNCENGTASAEYENRIAALEEQNAHLTGIINKLVLEAAENDEDYVLDKATELCGQDYVIKCKIEAYANLSKDEYERVRVILEQHNIKIPDV